MHRESDWPRVEFFSRATIAMAFFAALAILLLFLFYFFRGSLHSDDAIATLLGESIVRSGSLLPKDWLYANGDLMMPSAASIAALAMLWMRNGYYVHTVASSFALVLVLASTIYALRVLSIPRVIVLFFCLLSVAGFCRDFLYLLYAQASYFWWHAGIFLGVALICRARFGERGGWRPAVALWLVVFLLSFSNPIRVALMVVLPLYLFDRALALGRSATRRKGTFLLKAVRWLGIDDPLTCFALGAAFLLALLLHESLKYFAVYQTLNGAAALHWGGWAYVGKTLLRFPQDWLSYLGGLREGGQVNPIVGEALYFYRKAFAFWLSWVGVSEIWKIRRQPDPIRRALAVALIGAFVPIFFLYNFFEPLAVNGGTIRYFQGAIAVLLILAALRMKDYLERFELPTLSSLSVMALLLVAISLQRFLPAADLGTARFWDIPPSKPMQLAEVLKREGLQWGYATYWNAGAVTVVSDYALRVSPIFFYSDRPAVFPVMRSLDWYEPRNWTKQTFLALEYFEATPAQLRLLDSVLGPPERTIDAAALRIMVYDYNIAEHILSPKSTEVDEPISPTAARLLSAQILPAGGPFKPPRRARVELQNEGPHVLGGGGKFPLSVGVSLFDALGHLVRRDWLRTPLYGRVDSGERLTMNLVLPRLEPGDWQLRFDLVQEGVAWFGDRGQPTIDLPLHVPKPADEILQSGMER